VKTSIEDWTSFIKSFTLPNYDKGELWKISTTPLIVVHLNFKKAESKDDKKKKTKTGKKAEDEQSAEIPTRSTTSRSSRSARSSSRTP
jgi:hypothetical protein